MYFQNRSEAGRLLSERLSAFAPEKPVVIALPRGGVPVAREVAQALNAPLDVIVVRKLGAPDNPEFGFGAVAEDGGTFLDNDTITTLGLSQDEVEHIKNVEIANARYKAARFRGEHEPISVTGRTVILVDDGVATGVTAIAAGHFLDQRGAEKVILAVPVCAAQTAPILEGEFEQVVCLMKPREFFAVGQWYHDFSQVTDEEVTHILEEMQAQSYFSQDVQIRQGNICLEGRLTIPHLATGMVIFAHGSCSSRNSPRNIHVARILNAKGLGTLLFDLLTADEAEESANVFDIAFLAERLEMATQWFRRFGALSALPIGYMGSGTGAAAALWAASRLGRQISAVVSRGGRADLAMARLSNITAPVLLIVGGDDEGVRQLNQQSLPLLSQGELVTIPHATHLFEEPGALDDVAAHATRWFRRFLVKKPLRRAA